MLKKFLLSLVICLVLINLSPLTALGSSQEATEIQQMLICPSSADLGITVYNNPDSTSEAIKQEIDKKLAAGETKDQVMNDFVAQYGPAILAAPPKKGLGLVAWIIPPVFIVFGFVVMFLIIKRNKRNYVNSDFKVNPDEIDPELDKEILRYL